MKIRHDVVDSKTGQKYAVYAYRKLTERETVQAIRIQLSQLKKKQRPKKDQTLHIYTIIGHDD